MCVYAKYYNISKCKSMVYIQAGRLTGDRLWRMPLFAQYRKQMKSDIADINNIGTRDRSAGSCTAASFLKEFVGTNKWAHLDIAGVMQARGEVPYLGNGMSGKDIILTLLQFLDLPCCRSTHKNNNTIFENCFSKIELMSTNLQIF